MYVCACVRACVCVCVRASVCVCVFHIGQLLHKVQCIIPHNHNVRADVLKKCIIPFKICEINYASQRSGMESVAMFRFQPLLQSTRRVFLVKIFITRS